MKPKVKKILLIIIALLLVTLTINTIYLIVEIMAEMQHFVNEDKAGATDAALGSILLIPVLIGSALVAAVTIFGAIIVTGAIFIGAKPSNSITFKRYQNRVTISTILAVCILGITIIISTVVLPADTDVIYTSPGILLFGILTSIWVVLSLNRIRLMKRQQTNSFASDRANLNN